MNRQAPQAYVVPVRMENSLQYRDPRILITISEVICEEFQISIHDLEKTSRKREIVVPRSTWLCVMREFTSLSLARIGEIGGKVDHSTVLHSVRRIRKKWLMDKTWGPKISRVYERLEKMADIGLLEETEQIENPPD